MLKKPNFYNIFDTAQSSRLEMPAYNSREIEDLLLYFNWFADKPACQLIIDLLRATQTFRNVTSPKFAELRKKNKTREDLTHYFNELTKVLTTTQNELQSLPANSADRELVSTALDYSRRSIQQRINALKQTEDDLYSIYQSHPALQKTLENIK